MSVTESTKSDVKTCQGIKKDKNRCNYKANYGDYCKKHLPNKSDEECSICQDIIKYTHTSKCVWKLECGHMFHRKCLKQWEKISPTCPVCRHHIPTNKKNSKKRQQEIDRRNIERIREQEAEDYEFARQLQTEEQNIYNSVYRISYIIPDY